MSSLRPITAVILAALALFAVAAAPAWTTPFAYISGAGGVVVDTATDTVVATVPGVGASGAQGVAMNPAGSPSRTATRAGGTSPRCPVPHRRHRPR